MDGEVDFGERLGVPPRLVASVALGTLLNPLNSSMIAVAVVTIQRHFEVGIATATWLLSGFYLSAAVGQPLMGRLVDLYSPRRLFVAGLALVLVASVAAPFAPGFWWLVAARAVQGIGSSAAFPAALVIFRAAAAPDRPPAGALAVLGVTASTSAALGPVLGGVLVALAGWQAVFLVNVPMTIAGIATALVVLPRSEARRRRSVRETLAGLDVPGIVLFATAITTLLMVLLSVAEQPLWWLAAVTVVAAVLLVLRERAVGAPFLDVRGLAGNRALRSVLLQQGVVNLVFYTVFFGLPIWLEAVRGLPASSVGPLMLPLTIVSLLVTPLAARTIRRSGPRPALVTGSVLVLVASLGVQLLEVDTPVAVLLMVTVVLGIPNGLNSLGLQTGLYAASPPERTGGSGGLFQTFRYLGAILASSLLGIVLERDLSTAGLHRAGVVITVAAALLVVLALRLPRDLGRPAQPR
ncbi:MAG TPA: MFS transporter [Kribbellaceae bacterium]|nr:MFS transporter [Kribbellaceae bacterium]